MVPLVAFLPICGTIEELKLAGRALEPSMVVHEDF
jgi:hypothetical protein